MKTTVPYLLDLANRGADIVKTDDDGDVRWIERDLSLRDIARDFASLKRKIKKLESMARRKR